MRPPVLDRAAATARLLREQYCGPGGILARKVDAARGLIVDPRPAVGDLGDYVQYTFLLGRDTGDEVLCAWSREQVRLALRLAQGADGLVRVFAGDRGAAGRLRRAVFAALPATDALWGMAEFARLTDDPDAGTALARFARGVREYASGYHHWPTYAAVRWGGRALKIPLSNPLLVGLWIEALTGVNHPPDDRGRAWALEMAEGMLRDRAFLRTGFFPVRCGASRWGERLLPLADLTFRLRGRPRSGGTLVAKGSGHLIFGLLALYRLTGEVRLRQALERWTRAALATLRIPDGRFANHWPGTGAARGVALAGNNTFIEVLLDLAHDLQDEEALAAAVGAADAWLARRGRAGAIPNEDGGPALLDPHVDLAVNMLKLAELTRRAHWAEAAADLGEVLAGRYALPFGLAWRVDPTTGAALESVIETKFLGLYLKLPLLQAAVARGRTIFADPALRRLATDR